MAPVIAAAPVLAGLVLLVGLRWPAARAMSICGGLTAALAVLFWGVPPLRVTAALLEAVVMTLNILLILLGALFLSAQLKGAGALQRIEDWIGGLSQDRRIQAVLVAWVMGSFFEGAAGFGTPAAITAPLLVARQGLVEGLGAAPFALAVGLTHIAVAAVVARTLGPELPSLLGMLARSWG